MIYEHDGVRMEFSIPVTQDRVERYAAYSKRGIAQSGGFTTDDGRTGYWRIIR